MMRACTILPLLCLATAVPEGLLGLGLLPLSSPMDPLAFLGQLLCTAMQAVGDLHESFTSPSSSIPAYNNSVYSQQGEVVGDLHESFTSPSSSIPAYNNSVYS